MTAQHSTATAARPDLSPTTHCPFAVRFGRRLPRGFDREAAGLSWRDLLDPCAPSTDRFHLAEFSRRPLGRGIHAYEAILAARAPEAAATDAATAASGDAPANLSEGFTARRLTTRSCGDVTAMSEMLGQIGARVEIERFHQYEGADFDGTESWCTILRAGCGRNQTWAMGFGDSASDASIAALLSAATRLHLR
mgnify:CR=1 FL=1